MENPYETVPYVTYPRFETHPDRLASAATLFGMKPAPVRACRVLELGCGDGNNLIPMAYYLPGSRFVGVDLAERAIEAGRRTIADVGLSNIEMIAADLRTVGESFGTFDYIIAHGVYSWVPEEVRDALLAVAGARLSPQGVAFISYNAMPGRHIRQMLREMMLYRTRDVTDAREKIARSRELLKVMEGSEAYSEEAKLLLDRPDGTLYHDELATCNDRFYFHEFAAAAGRHGLQYLGEAEPHHMFADDLSGDIIECEQYLDFLKGRRFRQTLLCRAERQLQRETSAEQMTEFLFSGPARGIRIGTGNEAATAVARALGEVYPLPLSFDDLVPYAGGAGVLAPILYGMMTAGFVDLHVYDFPCEESVTARPRASRLARYQAARSNEVTNVCHLNVELDDVGRRLLPRLDGTRTVGEIAKAMELDPESAASRLEWLASRGLLEA